VKREWSVLFVVLVLRKWTSGDQWYTFLMIWMFFLSPRPAVSKHQMKLTARTSASNSHQLGLSFLHPRDVVTRDTVPWSSFDFSATYIVYLLTYFTGLSDTSTTVPLSCVLWCVMSWWCRCTSDEWIMGTTAGHYVEPVWHVDLTLMRSNIIQRWRSKELDSGNVWIR